mmetsp:Transcript_14718/g.16852  ORF Transcript_14718/g.16852 Transcript_14718/m.16852 type:complete len:200 (-) Transcript_14718:147-746(-)
MTSNLKKIQIYYAPLPEEKEDEGSAALEHSLRAKSMLAEKTGIEAFIQKFQHLSSFDDKNDNDNLSDTFFIIIISCAADGSIHRSVRKTTKKLLSLSAEKKEDNDKVLQQKDDERKKPSFTVILLGHARCENSAKQMNETIYGAGRRIERSLCNNIFTMHHHVKRLETQVELAGPDLEFDPYLESLIATTFCGDDTKNI